MTERVNPDLHRELARFGAGDLDACFSCGNCTAICPLSEEGASFPRKIIHFAQVGMEDGLRCSVEPWLCYYCGECSETCPRDANPGETMMAARRWLTSRYDWTGLSPRLYLSTAWEIAAVSAVALFVAWLFYAFHGPMVTDRVELNTFAPVKWVELGDLVMAAVLSFFLLTNAWRMLRFVLGKEKDLKIPLSTYLSAVPVFVTNLATQKRWRGCGEDKTRWLKHFLLVSGYVTMLVLILVFLRWFQTDEVYPLLHPQRLLGYYATAVLLWFTVDFMVGRIKKKDQIHRFSEPTDWMFLILLFLTALTGILVHLFRLAGWPLTTYYTYVVHLCIAVPMLVVEVPFGKWAHLFYRPFALYLVAVKEKALALASAAGEARTQGNA